MSLKDLISTLIESVFTSKKSFIAEQAAIDAGVQDITITESGQSFVAPCSGYAYVRFGGLTESNKSYLNIQTEHLQHQHDLSIVGYVNSIHVPIQKGEKVIVSFNGFTDPNTHFIRFCKMIGGGLNSILQALGGGLCLLSHLSRVCSISSQRKLISTVTCKQPPQIGQLNNSRPTAQEEKSKQLAQQAGQFGQRLTAGFACNRTAQDCTYKLNTAHLLSRWNRKTMCQQHFRFGKDGKLATILRELHCLIQLALSFQQSAKNSFAMGGAL